MGQITPTLVDGVKVTDQKIIRLSDGNVFHSMKSLDDDFNGFGEAYFSSINYGAVRAWKRHAKMTLNIVVPIGKIRFVLFDDRAKSSTVNQFSVIELSVTNYKRLTVPPMLWMGFQGMSKNTNMLLNIADMPHDPKEADRKELNEIKFNWSI